MALEVGELYALITAKDTSFNNAMSNMEKSLKGMESKTNQFGSSMNSIFSSIGTGFSMALGSNVFNAIADGFKSSIGAGWAFNNSMEQATTNFTTMLGSSEKAKTMLSDLQKFASRTPFELKDLTDSAEMLINFGRTAEETKDDLKKLGDISMGNKEKFKSLSLVFGQVASQGKLMGGDVLQMINAGFNPLQIIAEKTGKTMSQLKDEMSKGAISFEMVQDAMASATSEGGRFFNSMENSSKTFDGQMSTLKDNIASTFGTVMQPLFTTASTKLLPALNNAIGNFGETVNKNMPQIQKTFDKALNGILDFASQVKTAFQESMPEIEKLSKLAFENLKTYVDSSLISLERLVPMVQSLVPEFERLGKASLDLISPLSELFDQLYNKLAPTLTLIAVALAPVFGGALNLISTEIMPRLVTVFKDFVSVITIFTDAFINNTPEIIKAIQSLSDTITAILLWLLDIFDFVYAGIKSSTMDAISFIEFTFEGLLTVIRGVLEFFNGIFYNDIERIFNGVKDIIVGAFETVASVVASKIEAIRTSINTLLDLASSVTKKVGGITLPSLPKFSIPAFPFASGGIVTKPTLAMIGEGGEPEIVSPISKLFSAMKSNKSNNIAFNITGNYIADNYSMENIMSTATKYLRYQGIY